MAKDPTPAGGASDEAITDVQTAEQDAISSGVPFARRNVSDIIANSRTNRDQIIHGEDAPAEEEPAPEPTPEPTPEPELAPAEEEPEPAEAAQATEIPDDQLVTFVLHGEEVTMPWSEAKVEAQKAAAAGTRFRELADKAKELDAREAALAAKEQATPVQPADTPAQPQEEGIEEPAPIDHEAIAQALQLGTTDEASAAIANLVDAVTQQMTPEERGTPEETAIAVAQIVQARLDHQATLRELTSAYPEVFEDAHLTQIAGQEYWSIREEAEALGNPINHADAMRQSVERAKTWRDNLAGGAPQDQETQVDVDLSPKEEAKRQGDNPPTPGTGRSAMGGEQAPTRPSASSIVEETRRLRGQPVL